MAKEHKVVCRGCGRAFLTKLEYQWFCSKKCKELDVDNRKTIREDRKTRENQKSVPK
jgi:endogenous inhibitor of DNA gyrase (YacG/DUF329 family)